MILGRDPRIHCKPLVNILVQYAGKELEKAQSSVVDVCFGFTNFFFDVPGQLVEDPDFRCRRCLGNAQAIYGRPCVEVQLSDGKLDVVDNSVYLGDCICPGGDCELATNKRCRSAWGKFRELLPLLTFKAISLNTHGQMYNSCVRWTMLYSSECWAL